MTDANSGNFGAQESGSSDPKGGLAFAAVVGEGDQVLLKASSVHGETALPLTGEQAARLGRALLTASVALHAGQSRPATGTAVDDCQFPVFRWIATRSNRNNLPLVSVTLPGGISVTLQLDDGTLTQCGESLIKLAERGPGSDAGSPGGLPPVI